MVRLLFGERIRRNFWTVKLKESSYLMFVIFTDFQHANLYPFQNLSHGFIVKYRILKIWANFTLSILMKFIKECEGTLIKYGCVFFAQWGSFIMYHYRGAPCGSVASMIGSFSIDDGNGSENVSFKMNSRFFKLCRVYSNLLKMASVGAFPWSWFLEDRPQV